MADTTPARGRWAFRPVPPQPRSVVELLRARTLDAELVATVWLLLEGRVPLIVAAAGRGAGKTTLLRALLDLLPADRRIVELAGDVETFDWLPQATELGWAGMPHARTGSSPVRPDDTVLVAAELSDHTPAYTWGDAARVFVRAASIGYGLAATIHGDSLDDVFATLASPEVRLTDDELSRLGVVLILRQLRDGRRRVVASHFVRPVARDLHGHVQRLGPAVLATWDPSADAFEHFGWGITPELATRVGRKPGDFELEVETRRQFLSELGAGGIVDVDAVRTAVTRYQIERAGTAIPPGPPMQAKPH